MGILLPSFGELPSNVSVLGLGVFTLVLAYIIYGYVQRRHEHQVRC